jgi:hypothetical protein
LLPELDRPRIDLPPEGGSYAIEVKETIFRGSTDP